MTRRPSTGRPLGRMTTASPRSAPAVRQPSIMAPDMLPQPMNQIGFSVSSSLPVGVDQGRGDGFAGRFPAPENELEYGVEALALLKCGLDNGFSLIERQPVVLARVENGRVTEYDQAGARPHFEMAEPELLVDEPKALV